MVRSAKAVFTGTVLLVRGRGPYELRYPVRFKVETAYKGAIRPVMRVISWGGGDAACGLLFEEEKRYTVFAYEHRGRLESNLCTGTTNGAIDEELYGVTAKPIPGLERAPQLTPRTEDEGDDKRWGLAAIAGGMLAMASAALLAVRGRGRLRR